jgi:hypothetical protein
MNTKKTFWILISSALILGGGGLLYGFLTFSHTNELGLSRFDLRIGDHPDMDLLRIKTTSAANTYLALNTEILSDTIGEPYEIKVDFSSAPHIRALGFRSSFYYFCWDIYLPYTLKTKSGDTYTVAVQLSDRITGNTHDTDQFHALRAIVINDEDQIITEIAPGQERRL